MFTSRCLLVFTTISRVVAMQSRNSNATLNPWEVPKAFIIQRSPSADPANTGGLFYVNITVSDPQKIAAARSPTGEVMFPPSSSWCSMGWNSIEAAHGIVTACGTWASQWTFEVLNGQDTSDKGSTGDSFLVRFARNASLVVSDNPVWKTFMGTARFSPNYNLDSVCNDLQTDCTYQLKREFIPLYINQSMTGCRGECD